MILESVPADGARVETAPAEVRLRFNEPVSPVAVTLLAPGGRMASPPGPVTAEDGLLRVPLPVPAESGTWLVSYRVSSADGHPVAGSILFGVGSEPDRAAGQGEEGRSITLLASLAARALHYASLLAAAGGALFLLAAAPAGAGVRERIARGLLAVSGVAGVAVVVNLGLAGVVLTGGSPGSLLDGASWAAGIAGTAGTSAAAALAGLALLALGLWRGGRTVLLAGALVALAALALTGHAATAAPRWVSMPLVAVHGLVAAFWLGSLLPLLVVLKGGGKEALPVVQRFSGLAMAAVALLLLSGVGLSILQLADPAAVLGTVYGQIWAAKMVAVAAVVAMAAHNRVRLTPRLATHAGTAERLAGSIRAELVVLGVVLPLLTAGLGTTPPPRALGVETPERAGGYLVVTAVRDRAVTVEVSPARIGTNRLLVRLAGPDGKPLTVKEAVAELSLPAVGIEPVVRRMAEMGPGLYGLEAVALPAAGDWSLRLDLLVSDFEKAIGRVTVMVR